MRKCIAFVSSAVLFFSACSSTSSPVSPSPATGGNAATIAGTWTGTTADSSGSASAVWTMTQSGTTMAGKVRMNDNARSMMGNGTMGGPVNGKAFSFHVQIPSGGFTGMMAACMMVMDGQGMMSDDGHTMTGSYVGTFSGMMAGMMGSQPCGGSMTNGSFTMTR